MNNETEEKKPERKEIPEWVFEQLAVNLTRKYGRYFTIEEVKHNFWIQDKGKYYKCWTS